MPPRVKEHDCVEMKNRIQAELLDEKARLGEAEMVRRTDQWFEESSDPLAVWWRSLTPKTNTPFR